MKLVVAAPQASLPRCVAACAAALDAVPFEIVPFAHDRSRDPTIDLPHLAFTSRPRILVLVAPRREDPATLEAVRRFGAAVIVWFEQHDAREGRVALARRRWVAAAADAVLVSDADGAGRLVDRNGNAARAATAADEGALLRELLRQQAG